MIGKLGVAVLQILFAVGSCVGAMAADVPFEVAHSQNAKAIPPYEILEITFKHDEAYENPWRDVAIDVEFISPSGKQFKIGGFHYGSESKPKIVTREQKGEAKKVDYVFDKADTWKARFAPNEIGRWKYSYEFRNVAKQRASGSGEFECVAGRVKNRGFVRQDPKNPYRWIFEDGSPFYPIGIQECLADGSGAGSVLATASLEGPFRTDRPRADAPPGAMFKPGPAMNPQNGDTYFGRYARAGFNIFRFSQENCSYALAPDWDRYLAQESIMTDELLEYARKYNFRIMYGIFGYRNVFNDKPQDAEGMEKVKRFVKYSVDRWGAYIDIWEFLNEQHASDEWYAVMTPYLKSIDPYHHPVTTSWERPQLTGIDLNAPHWYEGVGNELGSDAVTASNAREWKKFGKPVIVGEQGNAAGRENLKGPIGGVWDPGSALRMRIRNWTALFNEISFIFWNTSYAKDGHYMNIWLGPLERQYVKAMQDFAHALGGGVKMVDVKVSDPESVRGYGLASEFNAGVYLHHFKSHESSVKGLKITVDVPEEAPVRGFGSAKAFWYSPETGAILKIAEAPVGTQTFEVPDFTVDIALLITDAAPPDSDRDGRSNDLDDDDDGDGVADAKDAFPLEPFEWADKDGDMIGDNLDADDNGDGLGDDENKNGKPDHEELDIDGDGVRRAEVVPWDAFPDDSKESRDTDGDGIGDNADADDDGDGFSDAEEKAAGTEPHNRVSFPIERK